MPRPHKPRSARTRSRLYLESLESRWLMASLNQPTALTQVQVPNIGAAEIQPASSSEINGGDVTPPWIVSARLVRVPGGGGGIELTFSEPMDPASVENPANYAVGENTHRPNPFEIATSAASALFGGSGTGEDHLAKVKITSATYDPTSQTVTLTSARPLKSSAQYIVTNPRLRRSGRGRSAPLISAGSLTDVAGNPIGFDSQVASLHPVNGSRSTGIFHVSIDGKSRGASRPRGPRMRHS